MTAIDTDGGVAFAQLTEAYWLDTTSMVGRSAPADPRGTRRQASTDAVQDVFGRSNRLRVAILTVAVLTVVAALLTGLYA